MEQEYRWTDSMSVGQPDLDADHQGIIAILRELSSHGESADTEEVLDVLNRLLDYTVSHFSREEAYMRSIDYARLFEHEELHDAFITKIQQFLAEFREGHRERLGSEIASFLKHWLVEHIMREDKAYERAPSNGSD